MILFFSLSACLYFFIIVYFMYESYNNNNNNNNSYIEGITCLLSLRSHYALIHGSIACCEFDTLITTDRAKCERPFTLSASIAVSEKQRSGVYPSDCPIFLTLMHTQPAYVFPVCPRADTLVRIIVPRMRSSEMVSLSIMPVTFVEYLSRPHTLVNITFGFISLFIRTEDQRFTFEHQIQFDRTS